MINILDILSVFNWKKWGLGIIGGLALAGLIWLTIRPHFKPNPSSNTNQEAREIINNTYHITPRFGCATVNILGRNNGQDKESSNSDSFSNISPTL